MLEVDALDTELGGADVDGDGRETLDGERIGGRLGLNALLRGLFRLEDHNDPLDGRDKVEHADDTLPCRETETATELLEENSLHVGDAQEDDTVGFRHINSFVQHIYGDDDIDLAGLEGAENCEIERRTLAGMHDGGFATEMLSHSLRMLDIVTENENPRILKIGGLLADGSDNLIITLGSENGAIELSHADFHTGILGVEALLKLTLVKIIEHEPIVGRSEVALGPTVEHIHLEDDAAIDIEDIAAVLAVRRSGQPKQEAILEALDRRSVSVGGAMMGLVDGDVVIGIDREVFGVIADRLQGSKHEIHAAESLMATGIEPVAILLSEVFAEFRFALDQNRLLIAEKQDTSIRKLSQILLKVEY